MAAAARVAAELTPQEATDCLWAAAQLHLQAGLAEADSELVHKLIRALVRHSVVLTGSQAVESLSSAATLALTSDATLRPLVAAVLRTESQLSTQESG
jgi:hypothetical protein